jgi:hypothetical protein
LDDLGGPPDGVGVNVPLAMLGLVHGGGVELGGNPRRLQLGEEGKGEGVVATTPFQLGRRIPGREG